MESDHVAVLTFRSEDAHAIGGGPCGRDQTILPRQRKKWLRQPVFRQMDGCNVTDPLKWRLARQLGVSPATKLSCMTAPQPQGQQSAVDHGMDRSPIK